MFRRDVPIVQDFYFVEVLLELFCVLYEVLFSYKSEWNNCIFWYFSSLHIFLHFSEKCAFGFHSSLFCLLEIIQLYYFVPLKLFNLTVLSPRKFLTSLFCEVSLLTCSLCFNQFLRLWFFAIFHVYSLTLY